MKDQVATSDTPDNEELIYTEADAKAFIDIAATLPLDWGHHPADAQEGWEMLCRAYARYLQLQRELAAAQRDAERWQTVRDDPRLQGSRNGYATFTKTVDAAIDSAMKDGK